MHHFSIRMHHVRRVLGVIARKGPRVRHVLQEHSAIRRYAKRPYAYWQSELLGKIPPSPFHEKAYFYIQPYSHGSQVEWFLKFFFFLLTISDGFKSDFSTEKHRLLFIQ
jgi:hypothetical protein